MSSTNSSRQMVLSMYKALLRESKAFPAYNFRMYAIRRVRDTFRANKGLTDQNEINKRMVEAKSNLAMLKRQKIVASLYQTHKLIIEDSATVLSAAGSK